MKKLESTFILIYLIILLGQQQTCNPILEIRIINKYLKHVFLVELFFI